MKRREFIISSAAILGGSTIFSGCSKTETISIEGKVVRRKYHNIDMPLIALGCMRLPMQNGKIDMAELDKMVEYAMEHGANYFDTAYMYVGGKSENAIGEILKKYPRESFILADKCPPYLIHSPSDVRKLFEEQLKKCQVEYFDNYLVHAIYDRTIESYRNNNIYDELLNLKKEGKVKYIGFSFHGDSKMLKEVINEHKWDFCQLQLNYLDWEVADAEELYKIADSAGVPIIVMEPLKGGILCNLKKSAEDKLKEQCPDETQASFGLRWAASKNRVFTVLSGMSNLRQIKENINTFINFKAMSMKEINIAHEICGIIQTGTKIDCTNCKYCINDCPKGINIPLIFGLYNVYNTNTSKLRDKMFFHDYSAINNSAKADKCISCGICKERCPQHIDIPELLKEINLKYEEIKSQI